MDAEGIQGAFRDVCGANALEEDMLVYVAGIVESELSESPFDDAAALWELVGDYLQDAGVADDGEEAGLEICGRLLARLQPSSATGVAKAKAAPASAKAKAKAGAGTDLQKPVVLSDLLGAEVAEEDDVPKAMEELPQERLKVVAAVSKLKKDKAARRAERKAWRAQDKADEAAVWVDLPTGASMGSSRGAVDFHMDRVSLVNKKGSGDLLHDASCTFANGRRYGLLGRNGVGKSTFLDAVARREIPGVPACSIFYVRQEVEGDERTCMEWVMQADSERMSLLAEKEELEKADSETTGARLVEVYQRLDELNAEEAHESEQRAQQILRGLGFDAALRSKKTCELSGGWRMRVAIACALFVSPGLLLLDEPTNHLDLETVLWLEEHLTTEFAQTLLVVSHDREFLNEVVTDIVLFENQKLEVYRGDYRSFEEVREEHKLRQERLREQQEMKREHLEEFIKKHAEAGNNGCKAAAQRRARMRKLDRLGMEAQASIEGRKLKVSYDGTQEEVSEVVEAAQIVLTFPDPGVCDAGKPLLSFIGAGFGYGDEPDLFTDVSFTIDQKSRIALLGKNGCGKSTLIKLVLGKLQPRAGTCGMNRGARIEYIAQHHLDELDGESTPLRLALERYPGNSSNTHELKMRQFLGQFGLGGDVLPHQTIKTLSGGQKFRVSLALAMYRKPHLLVMDEPTNHLDMETIDALITAIETFLGGVVVVSHDQHLISSCCKELRVVSNKKVTRFEGSIIDYKNARLRTPK